MNEPRPPACPVDPQMLRRMAEASRNLQKQAGGRVRVRWFDWVPDYLEGLAAQVEARCPR